jgi:arsenate reductase
MSKPRVLVICTGNSMRSQMAEGLLRADLGQKIHVYSAGISPSFVHPAIIDILDEIGIDIRQQRSKSVDEFVNEPLDLVITVCDHAADRCPDFPHARKQIHKAYPDPTSSFNIDDPREALADLRDRMRLELRDIVSRELSL